MIVRLLNTKDSGKVTKDMDMDMWSIWMDLAIKVSSKMIKEKAMEI